jgi:hypothetical protein
MAGSDAATTCATWRGVKMLNTESSRSFMTWYLQRRGMCWWVQVGHGAGRGFMAREHSSSRAAAVLGCVGCDWEGEGKKVTLSLLTPSLPGGADPGGSTPLAPPQSSHEAAAHSHGAAAHSVL